MVWWVGKFQPTCLMVYKTVGAASDPEAEGEREF